MKWYRISGGIVALLFVFVTTSWPDNKLHLIFCDVGQGDASLIVKGSFQMLIDTGPKNGGVMDCLSKHIPFWDRELEVFVNTHPQSDHIGALPEVESHYKISKKVLAGVSGDRLSYGSLSFDILWPAKNMENVLGATTDDNASALVLSMKYPGLTALFTGDIGEKQELALKEAGVLTAVDVLKVAHHGSKYSSSLAFDEIVKPKWAVVSVGKKNSYGHPNADVLKRFDLLGSRVLRTDQNGEVEFIADGEGYGVK